MAAFNIWLCMALESEVDETFRPEEFLTQVPAVDVQRAIELANSCAALAKSGQSALALAHAREANRLLPNAAAIRRVYRVALEVAGSVHYNEGRPTEALNCFTEGLTHFSDSPALYFGASMCLKTIDLLKSVEFCLLAWSLQRENEGYFRTSWRLITILTSALDAPYVADKTFYERLMKEAPTYATALAFVNGCAALDTALTILRSAIASAPDIPFADVMYGSRLAIARQVDEARVVFERVKRFAGADFERMIRLDREFHDSLADWTIKTRAPCHGRIDPLPDDVPLVVYAGCDWVYWQRYGRGMVSSLAQTNPGVFLHLHLTDPDIEFFRIESAFVAEALGGQCRITYEFLPPGKFAPEQRKVYLSCNRMFTFVDALRVYGHPIFFLDIDTLIKRPLWELCAAHPSADIVVSMNHLASPAEYYGIGLMLVRYSEKTVAFFDKVIRYVDWHWDAGLARWFLDQTAMFCVDRAGVDEIDRPTIENLERAPFFDVISATGVPNLMS